MEYDTEGNTLLSVKIAIGNAAIASNTSCIDKFDNIYIAGQFNHGSISFGNTTLTNSSESNPIYFVAKYDSVGNVLWAKGDGGTGKSLPTGISIDKSSKVYLTGIFSNGNLVLGNNTLNIDSIDNINIFISKFDSSGNVLWAKGVKEIGRAWSNGISVDKNNNSYITGWFGGRDISFGNIKIKRNHVNNSYSHNFFVTKYDSYGNALWVKGDLESSKAKSEGYAVKVDTIDNVFASGFASDTMAFGNVTFNNSCLFIAKLGSVTGMGIEDRFTDMNIYVYPNPGNSVFTFLVPNLNGKSVLEIFNVLGVRINNIKLTSEKTEVNFSDETKGVYLYTVQSAGKLISTGKLILE